jgi:hypothetical protein
MDIFDKTASFSSIDASPEKVVFYNLPVHFEIDIFPDFAGLIAYKKSGIVVDEQLAVSKNLHGNYRIAGVHDDKINVPVAFYQKARP